MSADRSDEKLTERLMVQLTPRDLRQLQAIADELERPLSWVARRGIRFYIAQVLGAEQVLQHSDAVVEALEGRLHENDET